MRFALALVLMLAGCDTDILCDVAGEMRCKDGVAQMCNEVREWEAWQSCESVGLECSTAPQACSGYVGIACCW